MNLSRHRNDLLEIPPSPRAARLPTWAILLIGGPSSVGKTTAATTIAEIAGVPLVSVDDLRRDLGPSPFADDTSWDLPSGNLLEVLRQDTRLVRPSIVRAVEALADEGGGVIEGEGIEPDLATSLSQSFDVAAVYIIETEPARIRATLESRPSSARFLSLAELRQSRVVEMNLLYSHWLREQADNLGQPWVPATPWPDLVERLTTASGFEIRQHRQSDTAP